MPDETYEGQAPCPYCFESSGYMARSIPHTWDDPGYDEPDPNDPCEWCERTGYVDSPLIELDDMEEAFGDA